MSDQFQEILKKLEKLDQLVAGQALLERRIDSLHASVRQIQEQDLVAMMSAIQGVASTANGNSARIARLSELLEILCADGESGPRAATG
ncbi:MAG: hypothetical protein KDD11_09050 [Acidobacteria bacterium]|nr:hypothetical protein [Acidobacteriota bacterium]